MTTTQVVETSSLSTITVLFRNYVHLDDQTQPTYGLILLVNFYPAMMNRHTVFSLNFSSAGKGPFMDGKAKNIYFSKMGGGGQWSEGHGPALTGKFFIPIF